MSCGSESSLCQMLTMQPCRKWRTDTQSARFPCLEKVVGTFVGNESRVIFKLETE